jgi:hypothetical protein
VAVEAAERILGLPLEESSANVGNGDDGAGRIVAPVKRAWRHGRLLCNDAIMASPGSIRRGRAPVNPDLLAFWPYELTASPSVPYTRQQHNFIVNAKMGTSTVAALLREPGAGVSPVQQAARTRP